jgi:hypothetical protein
VESYEFLMFGKEASLILKVFKDFSIRYNVYGSRSQINSPHICHKE